MKTFAKLTLAATFGLTLALTFACLATGNLLGAFSCGATAFGLWLAA